MSTITRKTENKEAPFTIEEWLKCTGMTILLLVKICFFGFIAYTFSVQAHKKDEQQKQQAINNYEMSKFK